MMRTALKMVVRSPVVWGGILAAVAAVAAGGFYAGQELCKARIADREIAAARADARLSRDLAEQRVETEQSAAQLTKEIQDALERLQRIALDPDADACDGFDRERMRELAAILERINGTR